jgi:two-component system response regulator RegX3
MTAVSWPEPQTRNDTDAPPRRLLRCNGVELDVDGIRARVDGALIHLPLKEFQLLQTLMESPGRVIARRELIDLVWGPGYADSTNTLDVHILRLRRKLEPAPNSVRRIRTVRRLGYVFDPRND